MFGFTVFRLLKNAFMKLPPPPIYELAPDVKQPLNLPPKICPPIKKPFW